MSIKEALKSFGQDIIERALAENQGILSEAVPGTPAHTSAVRRQEKFIEEALRCGLPVKEIVKAAQKGKSEKNVIINPRWEFFLKRKNFP